MSKHFTSSELPGQAEVLQLAVRGGGGGRAGGAWPGAALV